MQELLSVTEFAQRHRKDPGNVRRMLAAGRLDGYKIGSRWLIPAEAVYPRDGRVTTGEYRNWRKKTNMHKRDELISALKDMCRELSAIYGPMLHSIVMYGSYARGTQTEQSDVDIALFLRAVPTREQTNAMIECVSGYELALDKVLSAIDINLDKYNSWKSVLPFYKNIEKEGIVLWTAA